MCVSASVHRLEEGIYFLRAGVTGSCEVPDVSARNGTLEEQQVLLTAGPSLLLPPGVF